MAKHNPADVPEHTLSMARWGCAILDAASKMIGEVTKLLKREDLPIMPDSGTLRLSVAPLTTGSTPDGANPKFSTRLYKVWHGANGRDGEGNILLDVNGKGRIGESSDGRTLVQVAPPLTGPLTPETTRDYILALIPAILEAWQPPTLVKTETGTKAGDLRFKRAPETLAVLKALRHPEIKGAWRDSAVDRAAALAQGIGAPPASILAVNVKPKMAAKRMAYVCDIEGHPQVMIASSAAAPVCAQCLRGFHAALMAQADPSAEVSFLRDYLTEALAKITMRPDSGKPDSKPAEPVADPTELDIQTQPEA